MDSPKARVQALKREIESLDKRLTTSAQSRPLYESLPLQVKIENPHESRRSELSAQLSVLRQRTEGRLSPLQARVTALQQEEAELHHTITKEQAAIDSQKRDVESKLEQQTALLRVLQRQYEDLQGQLVQTQTRLEEEYHAVAADFDKQLAPLERALGTAGQEWEAAGSEMNALEAEQRVLEERLAMCVEEMDGVTQQRAEFVAHREEMEDLYDDLKRKYGRDISDFISGAESKHAATKLKDRKNVIIEKVKSVDSRLEANSAVLKATQDRFQSIQNQLHSLVSAAPNMRTQQDMEKLETLLKLKVPDFSQFLEEAVLDINAANGCDMDEWILRQQMKEVDGKLMRMEEETQRDHLRLQQEATDLSEEMDRAGKEGEDYTRDLSRRLASIKEAQLQLARRYQRRRAAVEQWRAEVVQLLSQPPIVTEIRAADELILDDLRSRAQFQGSLDPLLNQYIVKLRERERYLQANQGIVADLQAQVAASEAQGTALQQEKDQLTREKSKLRQELTRFLMEEKRLTKRPDDSMAPVRSTQTLKAGKRIEEILGKVDYWEERIAACNRHLAELGAGYGQGEQRKEEMVILRKQAEEKRDRGKEREGGLLRDIASLLERKKAGLIETLDKITASPGQTGKEKTLLAQISQTNASTEGLKAQLKTMSYGNSPTLKSLQQRLSDIQLSLSRIKAELAELEADQEKAHDIETQLAELEAPKVIRSNRRQHTLQGEVPDNSLRSSRSASQQRSATKRGTQSNSPTRQGFVDSHSSIYSHIPSEADQSMDNIDVSLARGLQLAGELPSDSITTSKGKLKKYFRLEDASGQEQQFFEKVSVT